VEFEIKYYSDLNLDELYRLLQLRQEVFIVEQNCPYLDADGVDQSSHHVIGIDDTGNIIAHTRIVPKGLSYKEYVSIGRVVTSSHSRNKGTGRKLMEYSIKACKKIHPEEQIKISAQTYLLEFYESLGFRVHGEGYLEDGIPHNSMIYSK